jgi:phage terminase large subunit-like protein
MLYHKWRADRVIGEVNNGGDMVEAVIRHIDPSISYKAVHATRGKLLRAEPIAALYEQGRVHHVGVFGPMEDEMCEYDAQTVTWSPNRLDANVWAVTELAGDDEFEVVVEHHERVQISPDLDEAEFSTFSWG